MRGFGLLLVAIAQCLPAAQPIAPPIDTAPERVAEVFHGLFHAGPPWTFAAKATRAKRSPSRFGGGAGVYFAPDGETYVAGATRGEEQGGYLVSKSHPQGLFLACGEIHDIAFAPDSSRVAALDDEGRRITVWSLPDGRLERTIASSWEPRFVDPVTLVYRKQCAIEAIDATQPSPQPRVLLAGECGGVEASPDGRHWMIIAGPNYRYSGVLAYTRYDRLLLFDAASKRGRVLFDGKKTRATFDDPRLAPNGARVCYGSGPLHCIDAAGVDDLVDEHGSAYSLVFSQEGDQALYGSRDTSLWHVDFRTWTKRKLHDGAGIRFWAFFPGGTRAVTYNNGATVYDLRAGWAMPVFTPDVEVGGFTPIPGSTTRFTLGHEVGPGRTLYFFELGE